MAELNGAGAVLRNLFTRRIHYRRPKSVYDYLIDYRTPKSVMDELFESRRPRLLMLSKSLTSRKASLKLHDAARRGDAEMVRSLLKEGARPDYVNKDLVWYSVYEKPTKTALYYAAESNHIKVAKILLNHKASVNGQGFPPLHAAAQNGHASMVQLLLRHGALPDITDKESRDLVWYSVYEKPTKTALYYAAESNHIEVAEILLNHKASINGRGYRPLDAAEKNGHATMAQLLWKYIYEAVQLRIVQLLWKQGAGYQSRIVESERADEEFPGENNRRSRNLRDNMLSFRKIDQNAILNGLREPGIINEKEAELITRQNHWKERAYYLLETILQKGNQAIDVLVQVLREQGKHDMLALLETGKNSQPSKEIFLNNSSNHWQSLHLDEGDYDGWEVWLDSFYRWQLIHWDDEDFLSSPDDDLVVWMETVKQPQSSNQTSCNSFNRLQSQHWDDGEITLSSRDHIPMDIQIETDMKF